MKSDPSLTAAVHGFPSHVAGLLAGVTDKTLRNWSARGFVVPSVSRGRPGPGGQGVYSFQDLVAIRVADDLRAQGIEVRHLVGVVAHILQREDITLDGSMPPKRTIITDGRTFMDIDETVRLAEVRTSPGQPPKPLLVVPLGEIVGRLQQAAREALAGHAA